MTKTKLYAAIILGVATIMVFSSIAPVLQAVASVPENGDEDPDDGKVTICHKPGTPAEKTLSVPPSAVPGHLGHGDTLGPCVSQA